MRLFSCWNISDQGRISPLLVYDYQKQFIDENLILTSFSKASIKEGPRVSDVRNHTYVYPSLSFA